MTQRVHITIRGAVQGVGFRPFVYRLATSLNLRGWVLNSPQGVHIEAEGGREALDEFVLRIPAEKPPRSSIQSFEYTLLDPAGSKEFVIRESSTGGETIALVLPDIATCPDCLHEIFDPSDRRYLYPFTNCTNCGPRFTIIKALPYDRLSTSMSGFDMCDRCRAEYENPLDRRFHAQPNACADCGPHLEIWNADGKPAASRHEALREAVRMIRDGAVLAVKGIGGFHLITDATRSDNVQRLRQRKHREEKPFALMAPSLEWIRRSCDVSAPEARLLSSPEAPIVLLQRKVAQLEKPDIAADVAPDNPYLGFMLPSSPLHHIMMRELNIPVVATSGNLSDEPICTDEREAVDRLRGIADAFLVHNRPILRHADDSIARVMMGRELILRRARGYAPLPVEISTAIPDTIAVGAHLKSAVAVAKGSNVFISQHIGDLETARSYEAFQHAAASLQSLFRVTPARVVSDLHPDYLSTKYAREMGLPVMTVQHHFAHVASCMAENRLDGPVLGVSWDGTGYGPDGSIWGGEFLVSDGTPFRRVATFRQFRLPGGDQAIREPRRSALGLLFELLGPDVFSRHDLLPLAAFQVNELSLLRQALEKNLHAPLTSSAGRLFDVVASITGLRQFVHFEGQAAMELEFALAGIATEASYDFKADDGIFDWEIPVRSILEDVHRNESRGLISAKFHNTLVEVIIAVARQVGLEQVVLTGGCFQNKYLTERTVQRLTQVGFRPYWHQRVPPNDGGIALGQIYAASKLS